MDGSEEYLEDPNEKEINSSHTKPEQTHSISHHEGEEETISEGSISEHITSGSVENDRSFQEIEIFNQPSALVDNPSIDDNPQEQNSLDLSSFSNDVSNGLPDNMNKKSTNNQSTNGEEGTKNVKSILEEILGNSQFHSDLDLENTNSREESFNLFANLDLSDKSLVHLSGTYNVSLKNNRSTFELPFDDLNIDKENAANLSDVDSKRLQQLEEIVAVKDTTISALAQELDSFREMSNPTYTSSMVSATEYRQLQEECYHKLLERDSAIIFKNDLIQKLSESLDQSVTERKELLVQVEDFKDQIAQLQRRLQETTQMVKDHDCSAVTRDIELVPKDCSHEKLLSHSSDDVPLQLTDHNVVKDKLTEDRVLALEKEVADLQRKIESDKEEHEAEISRLRLENVKQCEATQLGDLKLELEKKHGQEVEELRTYFEKKCADLEKNYSEEVFSQQSRKISDSSSEVELSADFLLSSQPGPGGDQKKVFKSKEDVERLKENLTNFLSKVSKHSLEDINDKSLANIEIEVKNELNALFRIGEKLEIRAIENKYLEEISNLKFQLEEDRKKQENISINSTIQEVASSGDYELNEVVESYERRLQEQISLAKIDIINSLEDQIQRLASNEADDEDWPSELLVLRDKFTRKYEVEISNLKELHEQEINRLKDEHLKILNGTMLRARRRSLKEEENLTKTELELIKDRDALKREVVSLRSLLTELVRYFNQAEDELNTTLVENLVKQGNNETTLSIDQIEEELNLDTSSGTTTNTSKIFDSLTNKARVHLTPNFGDLLSMIEHRTQGDDESLDVSVDLKNELGMCLEKLKQEANAILALTAQPKITSGASSPKGDLGKKLESVSKQLLFETQMNEQLKSEILDANEIISTLKKEKECLENRVEDLLDRISVIEGDLEQSKYKIAQLVEDRQAEVVSEGYGEAGNPVLYGLENTTVALASLQEKARTILVQSRASVDPNILQLIEELCRVSEKVKDEAKRESRDLLQQIDAADKKYKTTQKFLEEQAAEREQERDEAQKRIEALYEQLKVRDKDRANCQMMSSERDKPGQQRAKSGHSKLQVDASKAEHLERQIQDLTNQLQDHQAKYKELESERDEAVEKIKILRDIITELEQVNDSKEREIEEHLRNVEKLECIVGQQNQSLDEFKVFTHLGNVSDIQNLRRRCEDLEGEVQRLRIGAELAGSEGALKQIKLQLFEIEVSLDKKTRELELLHSTGTNSCSSPSEDMSVRDLVRPQTPSAASMDECEVPLQQLARLKEKLMRHSRAEEAAIKRIQDLEMQVAGLKTEIEEVTNENDVMKRQIQEQVVLISDFQIRLDQQRIKAEHIEKQTNTSLELKIYDLQNEIVNLQEKIRSKDKTITLQEQIIKEMQERLKALESEMANSKDDDLVVAMQKELEAIRLENQVLKEKPSTSDSQILPNLVENIIQDKNNDIERLREKLAEAERQLIIYTSLNLNKNDLKTLANLRNSGTSIEQLISILDLSQPAMDVARHCDPDRAGGDMSSSAHISLKKPEDTMFLGNSESEISSIEKVARANLNYIVSTPLGKSNSTEVMHKSTEKRVRFDNLPDTESLTKEIEFLNHEMEAKDKVIKEMTGKLDILNEFEDKISKLQTHLDNTEQALTNATKTFEKEQADSRERETKLGVELAEKKLKVSELEKELQGLKEDSVRKDDMYLSLAQEKRDLENELVKLKRESYDNLDRVINETNMAIEKANVEASKQVAEAKNLECINNQLLQTIKQIQKEKEDLAAGLHTQQQEIVKLKNELNNKEVLMGQINDEINVIRANMSAKEAELQAVKSNLSELENTVGRLQQEGSHKDELVRDKDCELDILNDDLKYYQNQLSDLEERLKLAENPNTNKQVQGEKLRISELAKEVAQLQDLVREKDRVIAQMTEDQKQLHSNIKTIDSKIKETGNVFDLSNRLKNEQKKTADLYMEIHKLKANLWNYESANMVPVEEITGQLKKELECAAQIDSNIISVVSDQSLSSISEGHDAEIYKKALSRQKNQNKQLLRNYDRLEKQKLSLEQRSNSLEQKLNELQNLLEKEKLTNRQSMIEDAKLMEQLRIKLDGAMDYKEQLETLLEEERRCRRILEIKCEELKKPSSSSESTKYKSLPTQDALDLTYVKAELEAVKEEKNKLLKEIKRLQQNNNELENNLKYTDEMLKLEKERNRAHEEKFRVLTEREKALSEELLRRKFELEAKDREMDEKKIRMDELEQEKNILKKQKFDLVKALKSQANAPLPSLENTEVPEALAKLVTELKVKSEENNKNLQQIKRVEREKRQLEDQLRQEVRSNVNGNMPYGDLVARCNYLFAKSLKLESVKKALIWQKRYLVDFLESHRRHCLIEVLPNQPHENHCLKRRHSPINHFRAAVYAVMSIDRMKFLVRRWHTGWRKFEKINARHYQRSRDQYLAENPGATANFQVGQPVSTQNFTNNPFRVNSVYRHDPDLTTDESRGASPALSVVSVIRDTPWSGNTPPSKESHRNHLQIGSHTSNRETYVPLRAPQLLSELHERVEQIQEKLSFPFSGDHT